MKIADKKKEDRYQLTPMLDNKFVFWIGGQINNAPDVDLNVEMPIVLKGKTKWDYGQKVD